MNMAYNSGGVYTLPSSYLGVNGQVIQPNENHNSPFEDVAAALNLCVLRDGRAPMSAALTLSGDATLPLHAVPKQQLDALISAIPVSDIDPRALAIIVAIEAEQAAAASAAPAALPEEYQTANGSASNVSNTYVASGAVVLIPSTNKVTIIADGWIYNATGADSTLEYKIELVGGASTNAVTQSIVNGKGQAFSKHGIFQVTPGVSYTFQFMVKQAGTTAGITSYVNTITAQG
jgi:hypothetical protein